MVLKCLNLARLSFAKAFSPGYAQSVVAASQSSCGIHQYPSISTLAGSVSPWHSKLQSQLHQNFPFLHPTSSAQTSTRPPPDSLATFLAGWNKDQPIEDVDSSAQQSRSAASPADSRLVATEESISRPSSSDEHSIRDGPVSPVSQGVQSVNEPYRRVRSSSCSQLSGHVTRRGLEGQSDGWAGPDLRRRNSSAATPPNESPYFASTLPGEREISQLAEVGDHVNIPAAFDRLVASGQVPSLEAYNALLVASEALNESAAQAVPRLMRVYEDMVKRNVVPNVDTFSILLRLLSTRALEVVRLKENVRSSLARFPAPVGDCESEECDRSRDEKSFAELEADDCLAVAVDLFDLSCSDVQARYSQSTYNLLIAACGKERRIDDMIRVYSRMELRHVLPKPTMFISMIDAFASVGDLGSAIDTYNEYKSLVMSDGDPADRIERQDVDVYAALVQAYHVCNRTERGDQFTNKVLRTVSVAERSSVEDILTFKTVVGLSLDRSQLSNALARLSGLSDSTLKQQAAQTLAVSAADYNNEQVATQAFNLSPSLAPSDRSHSIIALCAMFIRSENHPRLQHLWNSSTMAIHRIIPGHFHVLAHYAISFIQRSKTEQGLDMARSMLNSLRNDPNKVYDLRFFNEHAQAVVAQIDSALRTFKRSHTLNSSLEMLRLVAENGVKDGRAAIRALHRFAPEDIDQLSAEDLDHVARTQAEIITSHPGMDDYDAVDRLEHFAQAFATKRLLPTNQTQVAVADALEALSLTEPHRRWALVGISALSPAEATLVGAGAGWSFPVAGSPTSATRQLMSLYRPVGGQAGVNALPFAQIAWGQHAPVMQLPPARFVLNSNLAPVHSPQSAEPSPATWSPSSETSTVIFTQSAEPSLVVSDSSAESSPVILPSTAETSPAVPDLSAQTPAPTLIFARQPTPSYLLQVQAMPDNWIPPSLAPLLADLSPIVRPGPDTRMMSSADPYQTHIDNAGSGVINAILDNRRAPVAFRIRDALEALRSMRRRGMHPRFYSYSKLILEAGSAKKFEVAKQVHDMANTDVPYVSGYRVVHHGWVGILDGMVAACLHAGNRPLARSYHQKLRDMGATVTSNTFGLYITTLSGSGETSDEATEAVKIFVQATRESVEVTPFLYNALIAKLGKARRIDDCLYFYRLMRTQGLNPTSVTYGTVVNALCRVSEIAAAETVFVEMEAASNYSPRSAPYHSVIQYYISTSGDRSTGLKYVDQMLRRGIKPTVHTFKLMIDAYASIQPVDLESAEKVLAGIHYFGMQPEPVHYAALINARGCALYDFASACGLFDYVISSRVVAPHAALYQALFEAMEANGRMEGADYYIAQMESNGIPMGPYVANPLITGWASVGHIDRSIDVYGMVPDGRREPSTYGRMVRAYSIAGDTSGIDMVLEEARDRGYPTAVVSRIMSASDQTKSLPSN